MQKITTKGFAEYALFAFNVFIVFLLAFADRIVVPYWLQPLGRLHPLLLHFPIVLLLLAMLLEVFRFKKAYVQVTIYQQFTSRLFLASILLTSLTAIMGLLLSVEDGYSGSILAWHKWTGVSLVFVSSLMYWLRNKRWYNTSIASISALITCVILITTGHYGATLTHGENFVLAPITPQKPKVALEDAILFKDVILPIFNDKCLSCHNMDKAKGSLSLADASSVLKGGKNGKLFITGNPEISLLLNRIHLPINDEKRMPPKGKPALTNEELAILTLWVKGNAELEKKVIDLPQQDSLRILATTLLGPVAAASEEKYNFSAADNGTIKRLNNDYRVITPLGKGSPALTVNIYNKVEYKVQSLHELSPIKKQIVSLNLNSLPVLDGELKTIASFENLRHLNLNFTSINGEGLSSLASLKKLKSLSISGTTVTFSSVKTLLDMKSLKQISLWRTGVNEAEIQELQHMTGIQIIGGYKDDGKNPIKLNQPHLNTNVSIFKSTLPLQIKHAIPGVEIRYTIDGSEPDSIKSPVYNNGIEIKKSGILKVKAYKAGWYGSDVLSYEFHQSRHNPDSIVFAITPNEKYKGDGTKTLIDKELGNFDIQSGKWIGYQGDLAFILYFKEPLPLQSISFHIMRKISSHILPPQELEIWGGTDEKKLRLLRTIKNAMPSKDEADALFKIDSKLNSQLISCIKIIGKNFKKLPPWHTAKGKPAWIFIDEILLN